MTLSLCPNLPCYTVHVGSGKSHTIEYSGSDRSKAEHEAAYWAAWTGRQVTLEVTS